MGIGKRYSDLPHTHLWAFYSIQKVREWREKEHNSGRPSSLEDFYRAHGLCFACRATGVGVSPVGFDGETPLFAVCQVCCGTAKL